MRRRRPSRTARLSPEDERAAAIAALDVAAAATHAAYDALWLAQTDAQERRLQDAWDRAHEAQNRAAVRLHAANRALGRTPRDVAP